MDDTSQVPEEGYDELVERTLGPGARLEFVLESQAYLLERLDDPRTHRAVLRLWAGAEWSIRRALLARIGEPGHEVLVPELGELAPELDASGRRDVILVLERIGGIVGEPILDYLLRTSPMSVRSVAADVLAELGTRFSVQSLRYELDHARDAVYQATLLNALDKIEARHPVNANQGSLTLAEDGREGALTLAGATAGEITLYERALEVVSTPRASGGEGALVISRGEGLLQGWEGVSPAPRAAPSGLVGYTVTSDHVGMIVFVAGMFSVFSYWISFGVAEVLQEAALFPAIALELVPVAGALISILGPTLTPILLFLRWKDRHEHLTRFLTRGEYATARVMSDEDRKVEYVDASGVVRDASLNEAQHERFRRGDKIPVLVEDRELLVLSRLQGLTPRKDGGIALRLMSPGVVLILCAVFLVFTPCLVGVFFAMLASF